MTPTITILLDAAYALIVASAAIIGGIVAGPAGGAALAILAAALYLLGQAVVADRRTENAE